MKISNTAKVLMVCVLVLSAYLLTKKDKTQAPEQDTEIEQIVTPLPKQPVVEKPPVAVDYSVLVNNDVPFTTQAPQAQWSDARFEDGCEEASVIMAMSWVTGKTMDPISARDQILDLIDYELEHYGNVADVSAKDVTNMIKGYYNYPNVALKENISTEDIKEELYKGNVIIVPLNGKTLGNPNFLNGGPERHMAVVVGYDPSTNEFIFNDPGTRKGKDYRYSQEVVEFSLSDYPTGNHLPLTFEKKMIVVSKNNS